MSHVKQTFFTYQRYFEVGFWIIVQFLHALVNAYSTLHEYAKRDEVIDTWQPYLWEFSSQVGILLLIPIIIRFNQIFPLYPKTFRKSLLPHIGATFAFSIIHIGIMVGIRKLVYIYMGDSYEFGQWQSEFFYEYRKDVLTYLGIIATIYIYRFIVLRIKGEASVVAAGEDGNQRSDRLLIKKLGKEFVIKVEDIEWIEAAGNYMNIHVSGSIYPLRGTMSKLVESLPPEHFVRTHRSFMVNIDAIGHIESTDSADGKIILKSGDVVKLSRRYKENLQAKVMA